MPLAMPSGGGAAHASNSDQPPDHIRIPAASACCVQDAATAFCDKHGLPDAIIAPLAAHIQVLLHVTVLKKCQVLRLPFPQVKHQRLLFVFTEKDSIGWRPTSRRTWTPPSRRRAARRQHPPATGVLRRAAASMPRTALTFR